MDTAACWITSSAMIDRVKWSKHSTP